MYMYFIPVFAQSFGASFFDLGLIGTVWALAMTVTPIFLIYAANRANHAWIYAATLAFNAFATIILILSRSVFDIIVFRFIGGVAIEAFWVIAEIMVTDLAPADVRVREMGRYGIAMVVGALIGPVIGGVVIENFGYMFLFAISTAVIGLSIVQTFVWIVRGYRKAEAAAPSSYSGNMRTFRRLLPLYLMVVCYGVIWGLITTIFPGYANSIGIGAALIGFLFTAFGVARIFSYATAHRYSQSGRMRTLLVASVMIFVGVLTLAVFPSFSAFLVGIILIGGSVGVFFPITVDTLSRFFPNDRAGTAVASYETAINIGETVGPYLAGMVTAVATVGESFLVMSVFGILMAFFSVSRRVRECDAGLESV
jgi:MFS family permease